MCSGWLIIIKRNGRSIWSLLMRASRLKAQLLSVFKALKKIIPMTDYMVLLTGTPSPNGMLDLWSQMFLIDSGAALGRTMTAYKNRFFESDYMGL